MYQCCPHVINFSFHITKPSLIQTIPFVNNKPDIASEIEQCVVPSPSLEISDRHSELKIMHHGPFQIVVCHGSSSRDGDAMYCVLLISIECSTHQIQPKTPFEKCDHFYLSTTFEGRGPFCYFLCLWVYNKA